MIKLYESSFSLAIYCGGVYTPFEPTSSVVELN